MVTILNIFKWYISLECLHKRINIFDNCLCCLWNILSRITIISLALWIWPYKKRNYLVTIYSCINLFQIFIQTSKNIYSPLKVSCTKCKNKSNTMCQNINRQLRKLAYDIIKSSKANTTQKHYHPLFQYSCVPFYVYVYPYINFW